MCGAHWDVEATSPQPACPRSIPSLPRPRSSVWGKARRYVPPARHSRHPPSARYLPPHRRIRKWWIRRPEQLKPLAEPCIPFPWPRGWGNAVLRPMGRLTALLLGAGSRRQATRNLPVDHPMKELRILRNAPIVRLALRHIRIQIRTRADTGRLDVCQPTEILDFLLRQTDLGTQADHGETS